MKKRPDSDDDEPVPTKGTSKHIDPPAEDAVDAEESTQSKSNNGLGTISLYIPAGRDLPDSGSITLEYKLAEGSAKGSGPAELEIVRIHAIQPVTTRVIQQSQPLDAELEANRLKGNPKKTVK